MLRKNLISFHLVALALFVFIAPACNTTKRIGPNQAATGNPSFLFLSDIHLNTTSATTAYGDDTGMELWTNFLNKADSVIRTSNAQFIVYTGDLPAHYHCDSSCYLPLDKRATHNQNLRTILAGLRNLANKYRKPLFYMPGNNDGLAGDYYSFADSLLQTPFSLVPEKNNPYPALNILSGSSKAPCMVSNPQPTMGYYAARPVEGLRLICLNTVIYDTAFSAVDGTTQLADGNMQMNWLSGQLTEAQAQNEKVYIAMHIPPGVNAYGGGSMWARLPGQKTTWLNQFLSLTSRYKTSIAGILYGHTHMDEVRRLYDSTGTAITAVAISCPGVTPQHYNNPGFKTVTYDALSKELLDFTTYYTTPTSTTWGDSTYTFSSTFPGMPNTTIYQRLVALPLTTVVNSMNIIFTVKNGPPTYNTQGGIEVKWGQ